MRRRGRNLAGRFARPLAAAAVLAYLLLPALFSAHVAGTHAADHADHSSHSQHHDDGGPVDAGCDLCHAAQSLAASGLPGAAFVVVPDGETGSAAVPASAAEAAPSFVLAWPRAPPAV